MQPRFATSFPTREQMQSSKSVALLFLLGAFVAGIALGFTADRVMTHGRDGQRNGRPSLDRMAKELDLTPAQRAQFDSIMTRGRAQMRVLWKPLRPQMDSLQKVGRALGDSTHEQLKRVLSPTQAAKLDQMRERGRKRAADRGHGDSRSPPTP